MGILEGKNVLVTGVTSEASLGYQVARLAQREGAAVIVSTHGRAINKAAQVVQELDPVPPVIELDMTNSAQLDALAEVVKEKLGFLDGIVHSVDLKNPMAACRTFAGTFMTGTWPDVKDSFQDSAYSLVALVRACLPILRRGSSVVSTTIDGTVSWPAYDWFGVTKSTLEAISRYVARYVAPRGVRSNVVALGPLNTDSKQILPGLEAFEAMWNEMAPLGWEVEDLQPASRAIVALLSDWFTKTTGDIVYVDGGVHAAGPS